MKNKGDERVFGIDLIRVLATFFVVLVHSYTKNGWDTSMVLLGKKMLIGNFVISLTITAIPLFMMTTGFFMSKKGYTYRQLKSLPSLFFAVFSTSLLAGFILKKFSGIDYGNDFLYRILTFQQNQYSWYIAIYIGVLFLVPFLNKLWVSLNQKQRQVLILTLTLLVGFSFLDYNNPLFTIWNPIYPFLFYFLGAYIAEYKPDLKYTPLLVLLLAVILRTFISIKFPLGAPTVKSLTENYGQMMSRFSIFTTVASTSLFLLFYKRDTKNKIFKNSVHFIGKRSLFIFLSSYVLDICLIYKTNYLPSWPNLALFAPVVALLIFILSVVLGTMLKAIYDLIEKSITSEIVPFIKSLVLKNKAG